jgi:hypothetical protein
MYDLCLDLCLLQRHLLSLGHDCRGLVSSCFAAASLHSTSTSERIFAKIMLQVGRIDARSYILVCFMMVFIQLI